jgi:hypothetical protein
MASARKEAITHGISSGCARHACCQPQRTARPNPLWRPPSLLQGLQAILLPAADPLATPEDHVPPGRRRACTPCKTISRRPPKAGNAYKTAFRLSTRDLHCLQDHVPPRSTTLHPIGLVPRGNPGKRPLGFHGRGGDGPSAAACQRPRRRVHGTLGFRVLTRPAKRWSLAPVPNRWQPSADARCAILRRLETVPTPPARRASVSS